MEKHSVSRLIGAPPGYIGYDDGGVLTKAVRKRPYSVVLFDEIEKAHPDIYNILLQILDEGALTDSHGRQISFKNTVIIMTSNIGAKSVVKPTHLGFSDPKGDSGEAVNEKVMTALKQELSPELLNRIDDIIIFNPLTDGDTEKITKIMLNEVKGLCREIGIELFFDESIITHLSKSFISREYGARPLRRAIATVVENPLSDMILSQEIKKGDTVSVFWENGNTKIKCHNLI